MSTESRKDVIASTLETQLRDLRIQRSRVRPALAFLVGLFLLPFGEETKGKPLPS